MSILSRTVSWLTALSYPAQVTLILSCAAVLVVAIFVLLWALRPDPQVAHLRRHAGAHPTVPAYAPASSRQRGGSIAREVDNSRRPAIDVTRVDRLDVEQFASTQTALYRVPLADQVAFDAVHQQRIAGWQLQPAVDPYPGGPSDGHTRPVKHQGATADWSPSEALAATDEELTPTEFMPSVVVRAEVRVPDADALAADTHHAFESVWDDALADSRRRLSDRVDVYADPAPDPLRRYRTAAAQYDTQAIPSGALLRERIRVDKAAGDR